MTTPLTESETAEIEARLAAALPETWYKGDVKRFLADARRLIETVKHYKATVDKHCECVRCGEPGEPALVVCAWGERIGDYNTGHDTWVLCEKCRENLACCDGCGAYMLEDVDYDTETFRCPSCAKYARLQATVDKLDKTKDGVPVVSGVDRLFVVVRPFGVHSAVAKPGGMSIHTSAGDYSYLISECCSTRAAAEAAAQEAKQ